MDAKQLLLTRQSTPRLVAPAPNAEQLTFLLDAAARVPDHGALTPWEFIIAVDDGLAKLADIFVDAAKKSGADDTFLTKVANMPYRAPMVITVVAKTQTHDKVPVLEQHIAAGCATMAMQQAAFAIGLGAVWRTGDFAFDANVNNALGLAADDQIVGFLYVGTPAVLAPTKPLKVASNLRDICKHCKVGVMTNGPRRWWPQAISTKQNKHQDLGLKALAGRREEG